MLRTSFQSHRVTTVTPCRLSCISFRQYFLADVSQSTCYVTRQAVTPEDVTSVLSCRAISCHIRKVSEKLLTSIMNIFTKVRVKIVLKNIVRRLNSFEFASIWRHNFKYLKVQYKVFEGAISNVRRRKINCLKVQYRSVWRCSKLFLKIQYQVFEDAISMFKGAISSV